MGDSGTSKKQSLQFHGDTLEEFRKSVKKVELPSFDEDPAGWIARAEVYFRVLDTSPELKVSLAQLCMEGATTHFFKALLEEEIDLTWEKLKDALLERYGGIGEGNLFEQLSSIQQEGSVEEYITLFERLVAQVERIPDSQYVGYFLHGLRDGIRGRVRSLMAIGLVSRTRLMNMARAVEMELSEKKGNLVGQHKINSTGRTSTFKRANPFLTDGSNSGTSHGSGRTCGNDWVSVKSGAGKEHGHGSGPKQDNRGGVKCDMPQDRGVRHLPYHELMEREKKRAMLQMWGKLPPSTSMP